jgi:exo-1,4-beta-D-glucosaminidase
MLLREGWFIRSSREVSDDGGRISTAGYKVAGWEPTHVPTTVLGALYRNGRYPDLFVGKNLEKVDTGQFGAPWWFRTEFALQDGRPLEHVQLELDGVNYRADVWLNGQLVANSQEVAGSFRRFALDVSSAVRPGANALAIKVTAPEPTEYTMGFVDWNPKPPDRNLGVWREVRLRQTGAVSMDEPFVMTDVDTETLASAALTILVDMTNHGARPVEGQLTAKVAGAEVTLPVSLQPDERRRVRLGPDEFPQLDLRKPRLWWPRHMGEPNLYTLELEFVPAEGAVERRSVRFGVRSVSDYFTQEGHRGLKVNGQPVLIRGGGWTDDILLDDDPARLKAQIQYVRHMNLNAVRLEGFWGNSSLLYDLCDEQGVILLVGWSCQWEWEHHTGKPSDEFGCIKSPEDQELIARSWRDQIRWLRNHPSIIAWYPGSDKLPAPELERRYLAILEECDPTRVYVATAAKRDSEVSGPSGMKMLGPYAYVPPIYWYEDTLRGGAYGFNTETGPGAQPSPFSSLRKMIPAGDLWPPGEVWDYHCARGRFGTIESYYEAMRNRYGQPQSAEEFCRMAQVASYEAMRAMFEAFGARRHKATGVIQWMLNSAWPKLYWQLYDHYLMPNGAFYGARKACQPLQLVYDYAERRVYVVNDTLSDRRGLTAALRITDAAGREVMGKDVPVTAAANASAPVMDVPQPAEAGDVCFLHLSLVGPDGGLIGENVYWLSRRLDAMDHEKGNWFVTPIREYADMRRLRGLPQASLDTETRWGEGPDGRSVLVTLANGSNAVAFGVEVTGVAPGTDEPVLPVLWDDNYLVIFPGGRRRIAGQFPWLRSGEPDLEILVSGWNVRPQR